VEEETEKEEEMHRM
jgi:hypothetical protein